MKNKTSFLKKIITVSFYIGVNVIGIPELFTMTWNRYRYKTEHNYKH